MAYKRTVWRESETPLSADNMNNIEVGIQENIARINTLDNNTYRKTETYSKAETYALIDGKIDGKIIVSNNAPTPSQGEDGDIWFVVT